uniref:Uncharacterized protein n=1 Tax=Meloidogyne javanica TaxID=6303 RepID=A0A915LWD1_MELJA
MKNNRFHKSLQKTPYEAVFGSKPNSLPPTVLPLQEEQMEYEDYTSNFSVELFDRESCVEEVVTDENQNVLQTNRELEARQEKIVSYRDYIQQVQKKRADEMTSATLKRLGSVDVGSTVRVPIDPVNRGKIDPRNGKQ